MPFGFFDSILPIPEIHHHRKIRDSEWGVQSDGDTWTRISLYPYNVNVYINLQDNVHYVPVKKAFSLWFILFGFRSVHWSCKP